MKLFDERLPFYKGNLHMHTTVSDGRKTPEDAMALYKANGYDFIAITDHWKVGNEANYNGMLVLPGVEYDWTLDTQVLHLVSLFPDKACADGITRGMTYTEVISAVNRAGGVPIAAHPAWSLNTTDFLLGLDGVENAEVYNTLSGEPYNGPRADAGSILDIVASNGKLYGLIADDDTHFYEAEPCRSYIMLQAAELSVPAILDSLKNKRFYATQGPRFENIELNGDELVVEMSPVSVCSFCSNIYYADDRCQTGHGLTKAVYRVKPQDRFVRVQLTDDKGCMAWSNMIDQRDR